MKGCNKLEDWATRTPLAVERDSRFKNCCLRPEGSGEEEVRARVTPILPNAYVFRRTSEMAPSETPGEAACHRPGFVGPLHWAEVIQFHRYSVRSIDLSLSL